MPKDNPFNVTGVSCPKHLEDTCMDAHTARCFECVHNGQLIDAVKAAEEAQNNYNEPNDSPLPDDESWL